MSVPSDEPVSAPSAPQVASAEEPGAILEARGLSVGYGAVPVVHGIDIVARRGAITAVLGPNGAGKSTTLLALSGVLTPSSGEIRFEGEIERGSLHARARKGLVFVPEERSIFRSMSVRDNLRVGLGNMAETLAQFPDLNSRLTVRAGLLSGGEQQMLTLGRALSMHPRVLLVDELSLGLAPLIVRRLFGVLRQSADQGMAVLLVEQHVRQVLKIADYVYIMRRGVVELAGPADELRKRIDEIEQLYLSTTHG